MKKVVVKKNNFKAYEISSIKGYVFNPKNKNISRLNIVNQDFIEYILSKKIKREISKIKRAIKLIVSSDVTIKSDCDIMINELVKITKKLDRKYRYYFNEFEYFERIKDLYVLNQIINYKKKIIDE